MSTPSFKYSIKLVLFKALNAPGRGGVRWSIRLHSVMGHAGALAYAASDVRTQCGHATFLSDNVYYVKSVPNTVYRSRSVRCTFSVWTGTPPGQRAGGGVLVHDTNARKFFKNTPSS